MYMEMGVYRHQWAMTTRLILYETSVKFVKNRAVLSTLSIHYIQMDFWLYILGVQFNFFFKISQKYVYFSQIVLDMAIHFILYAQHLTKSCQLE